MRLFNPVNRHDPKPTWTAESNAASAPSSATADKGGQGTGLLGRWPVCHYDELMARDRASLDIFWPRDDSLANTDNLPPPDVIAQEIGNDLKAALEQFRLIADDLRKPDREPL